MLLQSQYKKNKIYMKGVSNYFGICELTKKKSALTSQPFVTT